MNVWRGVKTTQTSRFRGKLTGISSPNDWEDTGQCVRCGDSVG